MSEQTQKKKQSRTTAVRRLLEIGASHDPDYDEHTETCWDCGGHNLIGDEVCVWCHQLMDHDEYLETMEELESSSSILNEGDGECQ